MYDEAVPGLDYRELEEPRSGRPRYILHFLPGERQLEIIEDVCDEYEVPNSLMPSIKRQIVLGSAPSSSLKNVERARQGEGLKSVEEYLENPPETDHSELNEY